MRAFPGMDGAGEQARQKGSGHLHALSNSQGIAGLAQNLGLAQDQRIQPGGDAQQVRKRVLVGKIE